MSDIIKNRVMRARQAASTYPTWVSKSARFEGGEATRQSNSSISNRTMSNSSLIQKKPKTF